MTVRAWLEDPQQRENFLTQVYACHDWQQLLEEGLTRRALTDFHSRYKYLLMAHDPAQYRALGHLLGSMGDSDPGQLGPRYFSELMAALSKPATRGTHTNVLQHLSGYLRHSISAADKHALQDLIHQYRLGAVPLVAPLALLNHHFHQHPDPYIDRQVYLHPEAPSL